MNKHSDTRAIMDILGIHHDPKNKENKSEMKIITIFTILGFLAMFLLFSCKNVLAGDYYHEDVAKTIAAEACGEGPVGLQAVANVIANRAKKHNITPYEVVSKPHQFSGFTAKNRDRLYSQCKDSADFLADFLLNIEDLTDGATHFENVDVFGKPYWVDSMVKTIKIGNHTFYKEGK